MFPSFPHRLGRSFKGAHYCIDIHMSVFSVSLLIMIHTDAVYFANISRSKNPIVMYGIAWHSCANCVFAKIAQSIQIHDKQDMMKIWLVGNKYISKHIRTHVLYRLKWQIKQRRWWNTWTKLSVMTQSLKFRIHIERRRHSSENSSQKNISEKHAYVDSKIEVKWSKRGGTLDMKSRIKTKYKAVIHKSTSGFWVHKRTPTRPSYPVPFVKLKHWYQNWRRRGVVLFKTSMVTQMWT